MTNGHLDRPVYQLQMPLEGIDDSVTQKDERLSSEAAFAALSALRVKEPNFIEGAEGKKIAMGDKEVVPRWMELYKRLVDGGWKWRVAVYIAWSSMPRKYRLPVTQEELATQCLGLNSDRAITTWRKKNPSIDETITMLQGHIVFDNVPDALDAMVEVATTADYKGHQDRKLMLEMAGIYTPSSKITAEMVKKLGKGNMDATDLSDDDLREIASAAGSELERRSHDDPSTTPGGSASLESTGTSQDEEEQE